MSWQYVSRHVVNLLYGNRGNFMPNIAFRLLKKDWIFSMSHLQKSQAFKSGDHGGHNPWLMTHLPKTSSDAARELFAV
jgi:hypothetical protein